MLHITKRSTKDVVPLAYICTQMFFSYQYGKLIFFLYDTNAFPQLYYLSLNPVFWVLFCQMFKNLTKKITYDFLWLKLQIHLQRTGVFKILTFFSKHGMSFHLWSIPMHISEIYSYISLHSSWSLLVFYSYEYMGIHFYYHSYSDEFN